MSCRTGGTVTDLSTRRNRVLPLMLAATMTALTCLLVAPPASATTPATLSLQLSSGTVAADGVQAVSLQVTATVSGSPLAGARVKLAASWAAGGSGKMHFAPSTVTTGPSGVGTTTITSTRVGSATISAAITGRRYSASASTVLQSARHAYVVFIDGGGSTVTCSAPGDCSDPYDPFAAIRSALSAEGYESTDLATFSYAGGSLDPSTGAWIPNASTCTQSADSYTQSLQLLASMVRTIAEAHPNSDISLVGLSQGGLLAFQSLELFASLPKGSQLSNVVTFDAPLGGIPLVEIQHLETVANLSCWSDGGASPAAEQIVDLWNSTAPNQGTAQGDDATVMCHLVKYRGCASVTNAEAVSHSIAQIQTWGNTDDGIFNPAACGYPGYVDATSSEIVSTAGGGLHDEGTVNGTSSCTIASHTVGATNHANDVAALLGPQS